MKGGITLTCRAITSPSLFLFRSPPTSFFSFMKSLFHFFSFHLLFHLSLLLFHLLTIYMSNKQVTMMDETGFDLIDDDALLPLPLIFPPGITTAIDTPG